MNRRTFLAAVGAIGAAGRLDGQDSARSGAADPLRDPTTVGQLRAVATPLDNADAIKTVERRLKCTCGCNLDIFTCRTTDFTCTYSPVLHQEVVALHEAGKSGDEIVAAFRARYGEQILLAPEARGFNLLGYLAPGAAVLVATGTLAFVLLRRHRARLLATGSTSATSRPTRTDLTAEQRDRLDRALGEIES